MNKVGRFFRAQCKLLPFGFFIFSLTAAVIQHAFIISYQQIAFTQGNLLSVSYGLAYDVFVSAFFSLLIFLLFFLPAKIRKAVSFALFFFIALSYFVDLQYFYIFGTHIPFSNFAYLSDAGDFASTIGDIITDYRFILFCGVLPAAYIFYVIKCSEPDGNRKRFTAYLQCLIMLIVVGGVTNSYSNSAFTKNFFDPIVSNAFVYNWSTIESGGIKTFERPADALAFIHGMLSERRQNVADTKTEPTDLSYPLIRKEQYTACLDDTPKSNAGEALCKVMQDVSRPNIIFIFAESFRATDLGAYGGDPAISKAFDQLAAEGIFFKHFYANGYRTRSAQVAAYCSLMPNLRTSQSIMRVYFNNVFDCLPAVLKRNGYSTSFMVGSNADYDFQRTFFQKNGFEKVFGEEDFPPNSEVLGWGLSDRVLFEKSINEIGQMPTPFFFSALTTSNHHPFDVPAEFQKGAEEYNEKFLESMTYTAEMIGKFVSEAKKQPWYADTLIFIFADTSIGIKSKWHDEQFNRLDAPHKLNERNYREFLNVEYQIPLVILGGKVPAGIVEERISGQIDLPPTIADMLGMQGYTHWAGESMLRNDKSGFAYMNHDGASFSLLSSDQLLTYDVRGDSFVLDKSEGWEDDAQESFYQKAVHAWILTQQYLLQENTIWDRNQAEPLNLIRQ